LGVHLIVVGRFEYADDPESYTSGSVATGRASYAGKVKGRRQTKRDPPLPCDEEESSKAMLLHSGTV
jgi:hypothetical protein